LQRRDIRNYMIDYTSVRGKLTRNGAPPAAEAAETNGEGSASLVRPTSSGAARVLSGSDARGRQKQQRAVNHAAARCAEAGAGPRAGSRWSSARADGVWTLEAEGEGRKLRRIWGGGNRAIRIRRLIL
jgi:hypothetical protein